VAAHGEAELAEKEAGFWRRNRWLKWVGGGLVVALAALAAVVAVGLHRAEPFLRARIVEELGERFHARVELDSFHMSLTKGLWAEGKGLRIWPAGVAGPNVEGSSSTGTDEPLIRLAEFRFHAPLHYEAGKPFHISKVELEGLDIHLPPRSHFEHAAGASGDAGESKHGTGAGAALLNLMVDNLECNGAHLVLETSKPGKLPMEIAIAHLNLTGVAAEGAVGFEAELTNPRPVGTVHTTGKFGPWETGDPGESPVTGDYRFENADLSGFKGIAGILSSTGHYQGTLRDLTVDGETDTPDFKLTHFGNTMALHTTFHALVDGTNGDTRLQPVDAMLGRSHFTAQGQVVRVAEVPVGGGAPVSKGHDIALAVNVDRGRIEDFLRLASHTDAPLLTGAVKVKANLHIPPGPAPVHERLKLGGTFALDQAEFASAKIRDRIRELSLRGQGRPKDVKTTDAASIDSTMEGNFQMGGGVITLPALKYTVPGATIQLGGTYGVEGGKLDFTGTAQLEATVSQMVGGLAGVLLKPADKFFKKNGAGTEVPIHIGGTREDPHFEVDLGRLKVSPHP